MHSGREKIVRGLVDVIVWMHRIFRAARRAEDFIGAIGDDLVDIHVGLRA